MIDFYALGLAESVVEREYNIVMEVLESKALLSNNVDYQTAEEH